MNQRFVDEVRAALRLAGRDPNTPLIVMCQSGGRAPLAARAPHAAGFPRVYTLWEGFEGQKAKSGPGKGQRVVNGWKNAGLPWTYKLARERMYFPQDLVPATP